MGKGSYTVDNIGDRVAESASAGTDIVNSSVSFTLGADGENLRLLGTGRLMVAANMQPKSCDPLRSPSSSAPK